MIAEIKVWWIPQVPGKPFEVKVPDLDTAILMCNTLADYDLFQFHNRIKPDYSNAGGIQYRLAGEEDWEELDYEDEDELTHVRTLEGPTRMSRYCFHADESFTDAATGKFIIAKITEGEPGYEVASANWDTVEAAQAAARMDNAKLGLTEQDVLDIRASSMAAHIAARRDA